MGLKETVQVLVNNHLIYIVMTLKLTTTNADKAIKELEKFMSNQGNEQEPTAFKRICALCHEKNIPAFLNSNDVVCIDCLDEFH